MAQEDKQEDKESETVEPTVEQTVKETVEQTVKETAESIVKKDSKEDAGEGVSQQAEQVKAEPQKKSKNQETSKEPTEAEIKKWIKKNPFECDYPGCDLGKGGRPYREKSQGTINLHKYNRHGVTAEDKSGEEKEKKKAGPKGEDIMEDIVKRTEAADLRGKLTVAIKRITRLGKDDREALEPELAMVKSWKNKSLKKDITDEEINYIEGELASNILPTIKDMEDEAKKEKKKTVEKRTKRAEDEDDDEDLYGYGEMKNQLKVVKVRRALDEEREERDASRRRREREDERREEEHQVRMQALKGGGGFMGGGSNNPMGIVYERIITFKHDEDGNVIVGENGQPIPESMRQIPVNPNAIVQSRGRGGDGGETSTLKVLKTAVDLVKGDEDKKDDVIKELREDRKMFMDEIKALTNASRDKDIYDNFNKVAGAISEINKKIEEDPIKEMLAFEDKLKEHNISRSETTPEIEQIRLEGEREKTRRSTDLMMMNKAFKVAENVVNKVTDGPMARAMAKKIDQSDIIAEEEELPEDEDLESEIEQEVAPQQEEQPPPKKSTRKIRGKSKKKKE